MRSQSGMRVHPRRPVTAGLSRQINLGTRSLDLACGLDYTTVAAHSRMLRDELDPFIELA